MNHKQVAKLNVVFSDCFQSVSPGAVVTEFGEAAAIPKELLKAYTDIPYLQSKDIADAVIYVLGTPPHVQVGRQIFAVSIIYYVINRNKA
jgi:NADP-dependent 3-hydroxy acid dehydrogenase YdfG